MNKKIEGWNITQTGDYYKAFKRINKKLIGVHLGKEIPQDAVFKLRRKEQLVKLSYESAQRNYVYKGHLHKTAPRRKAGTLSSPMEWLKRRRNLLKGRLLDYGCGYGTDADIMGMDKYDPNFFPDYPTGKYDTITCLYVMNFLHRQRRYELFDNIKGLLTPDGIAYIAVWNISKPHRTTYGTTYRPMKLKLPMIHKEKHFVIYELRK